MTARLCCTSKFHALFELLICLFIFNLFRYTKAPGPIVLRAEQVSRSAELFPLALNLTDCGIQVWRQPAVTADHGGCQPKNFFKAAQVHRQWLPGEIDARTALKDSSPEQSLGTEIEAHLWQSICDITHHGGNVRRDGRWKTQVAYSINPTYWKCSRTCTLEEHSTANSQPGRGCSYFCSALKPSLCKNKHDTVYKWL